MEFNRLRIVLLMFFLTLFAGVAGAQETTSRIPDVSKGLDLPDTIRETLAKGRLKAEEEEFKELIKQSEEAVKLGEELIASFEAKNAFSDTDTKRIDRLEKVVKKIRQDLGAEDDSSEDHKVDAGSLMSTLNAIKEKTSGLLKELKGITRYSVSVVAIESSNSLLKLIRFIKFSRK